MNELKAVCNNCGNIFTMEQPIKVDTEKGFLCNQCKPKKTVKLSREDKNKIFKILENAGFNVLGVNVDYLYGMGYYVKATHQIIFETEGVTT